MLLPGGDAARTSRKVCRTEDSVRRALRQSRPTHWLPHAQSLMTLDYVRLWDKVFCVPSLIMTPHGDWNE